MEESDSLTIIGVNIGDKMDYGNNNNDDGNKNKSPFTSVFKISKFTLCVIFIYLLSWYSIWISNRNNALLHS